MIKYDRIKLWTAEEAKEYLIHIQELVDKKIIPRIPYKIWKEIKNYSNASQEDKDLHLIIDYDCTGRITCQTCNKYDFFPLKSIDAEWKHDDLEADCDLNYYSEVWDDYLKVKNLTQTENTISTSNEPIINIQAQVNKNPVKIMTVDTERKEEKNMFNFDFGVYNTDAVRFSPYGLAVYNSGSSKYVAYDQANAALMDVDIINFKMDNMLYKIPVAIKDVTEGDIIMHNKRPVIVIKVCGNENKLKAVDPATAEEKVILPIKSPFKFDFVTKVVSVMDFSNTKASESSPFGNFLPFMLMSNSDNAEMNPFMMMALMGNNGFELDNPLMLMALAGNNNAEMGKMLPLMYFMTSQK